MTIATEPHANGTPAEPACVVPPPLLEIPNVSIIRTGLNEIEVCTNKTTVADAAAELLRLRPLPPGVFWCAEASPGKLPGKPCPSPVRAENGWRHVVFRLAVAPREVAN